MHGQTRAYLNRQTAVRNIRQKKHCAGQGANRKAGLCGSWEGQALASAISRHNDDEERSERVGYVGVVLYMAAGHNDSIARVENHEDDEDKAELAEVRHNLEQRACDSANLRSARR